MGAPTLWREGAPTYDFAKFSRNCIKWKEFGPGSAHPTVKDYINFNSNLPRQARVTARMTVEIIPMNQLIVSVSHRDVDLSTEVKKSVRSVSSPEFNPTTLSLKSV